MEPPPRPGSVDGILTPARHHDTVGVVETSGATSEHGLDDLDPATTPARDAVHLRRMIAARTALEDAERELHEAVAAARAAGDSWTIVGAALDTTRQAAQQRFGRP